VFAVIRLTADMFSGDQCRASRSCRGTEACGRQANIASQDRPVVAAVVGAGRQRRGRQHYRAMSA